MDQEAPERYTRTGMDCGVYAGNNQLGDSQEITNQNTHDMRTVTIILLSFLAYLMLIAESDNLLVLATTKVLAIVFCICAGCLYTASKKKSHGRGI